MKEKYSPLKTFGSLPVHPDVFETLDKKLKHLGECEEGDEEAVKWNADLLERMRARQF